MKLEDQVCSLELAKRLYELMHTPKVSLFYWTEDRRKQSRKDGTWKAKLLYTQQAERIWSRNVIVYPAFTVAELGEMLPTMWLPVKDEGERESPWMLVDNKAKPHWEATEANARAKMLAYLIENKLITV